MELSAQNLKQDEKLTLKLRRMYEQRGFKKVSVSKFEETSLYMENLNFLPSEQIISFMDMNGNLLALKPDVTLSVVKNIPKAKLPVFEKLYYVDEVYRVNRENREYRVHNQIGVELIGPEDDFANIEVIDLAMQSLAAIGREYVLDLSHQGFVSGLLESLKLSGWERKKVLTAIHRKSGHDVALLLGQSAKGQEAAKRVMGLISLHGSLSDVLPKAKALIVNDGMQKAYDELTQVSRILGVNGYKQHLNLDFSVLSHLDYYNGLMFRGYVKGMPKMVLTGGRYDNLMRRLGKQSCALGFAVSLDDINTYFKSGRKYDFDLLIVYRPDCDHAALLKKVNQLTGEGYTVRLEREDADLGNGGLSYKRLLRFRGDTLLEQGEVTPC